MKIFLVQWYNEDDYGPMDRCYVLLQAESRENAIKKAKQVLLKQYKLTDIDFNRYAKHKISDLSKRQVLSHNIHAF
jgi:hypothetical protein